MTPPDTQTLLATDAASRRAAVTVFDRPVALEAGAGTGKTSVLVARVAWWCLTTGWQGSEALWRQHPPRWRKTPPGQGPTPQEVARLTAHRVAAITFTEAAAAELSQRLAALLRQLAQGETDNLHQLKDLLATEEAPLLFDRARLLLGELHHMTLDTIHGFCASLLRRHAVAAGLHPRFALDVSQAALSATVEEVMQRALHAALLSQSAAEQPLALLLAQGHDMAAIGQSLLWLAENGIEAPWLDHDPCPPKAWEQLKSDVLAHAAPLAAAVAPLQKASGANIKEAALSLPRWCDQWREAREEKGFLEAAQNLPAALAAKVKEWAENRFKTTEQKLLPDTATVRRHAAALWPLLDQLTRLAQRPPATLRLLQRALRPLLEEVQARLSRQGQVTFNELLYAARRLLCDQPAIAQLERQRLGLLLVDEFQDTDAVQCEIVQALGLTGQNRPSLFVVGDPKQCIYVWRRADLASYEAFLDTLQKEGGEVFPLHANFRSRPEVLDEVDRLLAPLMLYQKGVQPHFEPLVAGRQHAPPSPGEAAVEHWVSWSVEGPKKRGYADTAREIEARAIARDLVRLNESGQLARWADAAILLRAASQQEVYLRALREHAVPYEVVAEKEWFHTRTVLEAAALLRLVLDPNDHLALLTFLRSAVVGAPDHALIPLWRTGLPQAITTLQHPDPQALATADACVEEALAHAPAFIGAGGGLPLWPVSLKAAIRGLAVLRQSFHHEPLDVFFARWEDIFFTEQMEAARFGGHRRVGLLRAFFTLASDALQNPAGAGGPQALLRLLRQGAQGLQKLDQQKSSLLGEGVQVMSVHGAKGLEFSQVYLPDLHHQDKNTRRDDPNGWWRGQAGEAWTLAGHPSLLAHLPRQLNRQNSRAEEVRLLYVAATRAKNRLVFLGHYPEDKTPLPLGQTWQQVQRLLLRQGGAPNLPELFNESLRRLTQNASATVAEKQALLRHTPPGEAPHTVWLFPDLDPAAHLPHPVAAHQKTTSAGAAARWQKTEDTWALRQQQAADRQQRQWRGVASAMSHEAEEERLAPGEEDGGVLNARENRGAASVDADNAIRQAVGVLCHRALERLDLTASPPQARQICLSSLPALASDLALDEAARAQAAQLAGEVMAQFFAGPLCLRLFDIRGHVLGRETPLVLSPDLLGGEDAPLGAVTGTVDLLYHDPATGEVVVADYKTDVVANEADLNEKRARYGAQGAVYVTAVQHALGLPRPPRFELWFLRLGEVFVVGQ